MNEKENEQDFKVNINPANLLVEEGKKLVSNLIVINGMPPFLSDGQRLISILEQLRDLSYPKKSDS